jgi:predicted negative regulator of RcsB-dependent stress response
MATHLDLEEQEQLDQFKHFWARWGNLITGLVTAVLLVYASYNGWNYWQQRQATQAAVLYDTFENAARGADVPLMARSLADLQNQFGRTTFAQQAALLSARIYANKANLPEAEKSLQWVIDHGNEEGYVALARLRLSALSMEQKNLDKAKALLQSVKAPTGFQPLFDDRLGDIAVLQNKPEDAKPLYLSAYKGLEASNDYRRMVDYKLAALGVNTADTEKKQ